MENEKTEWIYNTPERAKSAEELGLIIRGSLKVNGLRINSDMYGRLINPKVKRFKISDMTSGPQYDNNSPKEFIAEIDEQSTLEDQVQIAHHIFTQISHSNSRTLYKGEVVNENILVDESTGLIAYRTHALGHVITDDGFSKISIDEDAFLIKKEGDILEGSHITGRLTYSGRDWDRIELERFTDGGNILNYNITRGEQYSKNKLETNHYKYDLTLEECTKTIVEEDCK